MAGYAAESAAGQDGDERRPQSFYLFDIDDNILVLPTKIFVYEKNGDGVVEVSTAEFSSISSFIGSKKLSLYELRKESFSRFADKAGACINDQPVFQDALCALEDQQEDENGRRSWQGPSWETFAYAVKHQRPLSFVTARAHSPEMIKQAISSFVRAGWLESEPNYLCIFPVNNEQTRRALGDDNLSMSTAELKRRAIHEIVHQGLTRYGSDLPHHFGCSDDDQHNVRLIIQAMRELKAELPACRFFIYDTSREPLIRTEICDPKRLEPKQIMADPGGRASSLETLD